MFDKCVVDTGKFAKKNRQQSSRIEKIINFKGISFASPLSFGLTTIGGLYPSSLADYLVRNFPKK